MRRLQLKHSGKSMSPIPENSPVTGHKFEELSLNLNLYKKPNWNLNRVARNQGGSGNNCIGSSTTLMSQEVNLMINIEEDGDDESSAAIIVCM
jgi:hypothetical protein